jgi:stage III sporulation protein SpoIIIAA
VEVVVLPCKEEPLEVVVLDILMEVLELFIQEIVEEMPGMQQVVEEVVVPIHKTLEVKEVTVVQVS